MPVFLPIDSVPFTPFARSVPTATRQMLADPESMQYNLKLCLLLFDKVTFEFSPLLHLGITHDDDDRTLRRKAQDLVEKTFYSDPSKTTLYVEGLYGMAKLLQPELANWIESFGLIFNKKLLTPDTVTPPDWKTL